MKYKIYYIDRIVNQIHQSDEHCINPIPYHLLIKYDEKDEFDNKEDAIKTIKKLKQSPTFKDDRFIILEIY